MLLYFNYILLQKKKMLLILLPLQLLHHNTSSFWHFFISTSLNYSHISTNGSYSDRFKTLKKLFSLKTDISFPEKSLFQHFIILTRIYSDISLHYKLHQQSLSTEKVSFLIFYHDYHYQYYYCYYFYYYY